MVNLSFLNLKKMNWIRCLEGSEDVEGSGSEQKIVTTSVLFDKAYSATKKGEKISLFCCGISFIIQTEQKDCVPVPPSFSRLLPANFLS
jgi:hypothetical protein